MTEVVVSSRPWHDGLADRLAKRIGRPFVQIGTPDRFTADHLFAIGATRVFVPHWSHIIPPSVFDTFETIIFHMTDLPYGRGGSPLQNLIVRGHTETKISALRCEAGLDTGPIYLKRSLSLDGTAQAIYERAGEIIESMIVEIIDTDPQPRPQSGEITEFRRRKPADGDLARRDDPQQVYDHIRMLDADGYPPAFVDCGKWRIEFMDARFDGLETSAKARFVLRDAEAKGKR